MSTWIILSWVFVGLITGINIFLFLKLKQASEQMMKMAFPGAKNMNEALGKMQNMMQGMQGKGGMGAAMNAMAGMGGGGMNRGPRSGGGKASLPPGQTDAQLKAAMDMLQKMQKNPKR